MCIITEREPRPRSGVDHRARGFWASMPTVKRDFLTVGSWHNYRTDYLPGRKSRPKPAGGGTPIRAAMPVRGAGFTAEVSSGRTRIRPKSSAPASFFLSSFVAADLRQRNVQTHVVPACQTLAAPRFMLVHALTFCVAKPYCCMSYPHCVWSCVCLCPTYCVVEQQMQHHQWGRISRTCRPAAA